MPHESALRSFIIRMGLPEGLDVDDVVQESYSELAAMESVETIRNPRAYFFSVARSTVLMHIRRSKIVAIRAVDHIEAYPIATEEPSPEQQVSDREQLYLLGVAIAELPDPGRTALLLRMMDELPHKEIARRLGMTDNAVQKSIAKSVGLLLRKLSMGGNGSAGASIATRARREEVPDGGERDQRGN